MRKKGIGEAKQVLAALALFEEVISDHRQVELGGNQDVNLITDAAVLEIRETTKIRELYRALSEIPETAKAKELKVKQEVAKEWKEMEEIQEANSADQIYQLEALRFKMKSKYFNLSSSKSEKILENEMPGMRRGIPKGKRSINTGMRLGELESKRSENMELSGGRLSREFRRGGLFN